MNKQMVQDIVAVAKENTNLSAIKEYQMQNDHCVVAPVTFKDTQDNSGIVNPEQYDDKNEYGVILATGPGRMTENGMTVYPGHAVGQTVLYGQYSYTKLRVNGVDLNLIRHDDIIAVLPSN